jgi:hypothetical protein
MLRPHISRSTLASIVGGACVVAAVGCASPAPAGPAGTTQVRILQPAQSLNDDYRVVAPIVCEAAALKQPVTRSGQVGNAGDSIPLRYNGAPRATLRVGRHRYSPLTYELTAEKSDIGEFRFRIRRTGSVNVPSAQAPNSFTLVVTYPQACKDKFGVPTIFLVRLSDNTAIPHSAHDSDAGQVTFRMDRLSRFVISH